MVKTPAFSVLLPTFNRADVIGYAISSVLNQTFKDFELLIVGDGCTDTTEKVVSSFIKKDTRVKWFPLPKSAGFGYDNRNKVLANAQGTYVAYIGHDDIWLPDHLSLHNSFYKENPEYLIAYNRPLWFTEEGLLMNSFFNTNIPSIKSIFMKTHNEVPAAAFTYKRNVFEDSNHWIPGTVKAGDWDLWRRIINFDKKRRIGFISAPGSINFKSNWRGKDEYLTEHVKSLQKAIKESPEMYDYLKLFNPKSNEVPQKVVWKAINSKADWVQEYVQKWEEIEDELLYRLSIKNNRLRIENDHNKYLVKRITNTKGYKLLTNIRKVKEYFK